MLTFPEFKPTFPKESWVLPRVLEHQAKTIGDRPFLKWDDNGPEYTFAETNRKANQLAHGLQKAGLVKGDCAVLFMPNSLEYLLSCYALNKIGAIEVPINTAYKGSFLEHQVNISKAQTIIADLELLPAVQGSIERMPTVARIVIWTRDGKLPAQLPTVGNCKVLSFQSLYSSDDSNPGIKVLPQDIGAIMFTSGTTGLSKGVMMPHAHLVLWGVTYGPAVRMTAQDRLYVCTPLFHMSALGMQVIGALIAGASVYCVERFSPTRWIEEVRSSAATIAGLVGVLGELIYRTPAKADDGANSLRTVFSAAIPEELAIGFARRFGVDLVQGYGQTECNMVTYSGRDDPLTIGCTGRPLDRYFEVRIVDPDTDEPLAAGALGEIVVRPKKPGCFMQGYYRMPEKAAEAWRNLWLHTGDAGRFDSAGRLFFVDRIKDRIRRRGENISAFEIEEVLSRFSPIEECAAVGIRVEGAGGEDEIKACVVAKEGATIDRVALLDFCVARMPRYAVPRFIEILAELPKTASGKVQRQELRNRGLSDTTWDRETIQYTIPRDSAQQPRTSLP